MRQLTNQQSTTDVKLLLDFLAENLYKNEALLFGMTPDELIDYLFTQFYVFLYGSLSLDELYRLFQQESYRACARRSLAPDECEYLLRSSRFVQFVQTMLNNTRNESIIPTDARTPGEDLTHICA